jgi:hypothetical protein
MTANSLLYDEVGIYEVSGKKIAVNMYDDRESNTTIDASNLSAVHLKKMSPRP